MRLAALVSHLTHLSPYTVKMSAETPIVASEAVAAVAPEAVAVAAPAVVESTSTEVAAEGPSDEVVQALVTQSAYGSLRVRFVQDLMEGGKLESRFETCSTSSMTA